MIEREAIAKPVALREVHPCSDCESVIQHVVLGQQNALGETRRSRGVLDIENIVWRALVWWDVYAVRQHCVPGLSFKIDSVLQRQIFSRDCFPKNLPIVRPSVVGMQKQGFDLWFSEHESQVL